jgi:acetyl esterase/lipase
VVSARLGGAVLAVVLAAAGCATSSTDPGVSRDVEEPTITPTVHEDYLPGLRADMRVPAAAGPAPLVILVPGGGWQSADPTGLIPLAESLTDAGATTVTMTYSTTATRSEFPVPVDDVACAVRWAAEQANAAGRAPQEVLVLGHSAGGHLASLVALSAGRFGGDCPAPPVTVDGLVGIAGVYDVRALGGTLDGFFGASASQEPDRWDDGDPMHWAASGSSSAARLRALLIHGDADTLVPLRQTTDFADALLAAGSDVTVEVVPEQTHDTIYAADVAGPLVKEWLATWP